jgi:hypothetical protein
MEEKRSLQSIPDDELLQRLAELTTQSRHLEVDIVAHIAEVEERGLYAREAFPSMFVYCRDALHLSEQEAYLRIAVARASLEHPILLTMLADGRLHLTAIGKLAPHLTRENRDALLERAVHKTKRQIEELLAEFAPRPDVPAVMRKLPEGRTRPGAPIVILKGGNDPMLVGPILELGPDSTRQLGPDAVGAPEPGANAPAIHPGVSSRVSPSVVQPLAPGRYKVQFTASAELHRKLERLEALMGSSRGKGDLAAVIEQAVTEKLERLEARRFGRTRTSRKGTQPNKPASAGDVPADSEPRADPSPSSRNIPAPVRRAVYERDGGRCRYVDEQGRRCEERDRLEFHHGHPFGLGGDHGVANVRLMCHAHNAYLAECDYGRKAMASHRRRRRQDSATTSGHGTEAEIV